LAQRKLIQYGTIGDTNNVASRICSVAKADEILVSHSTYLGLQDQMLPFEKLEPVKVKGKDEPIQVYKLLWDEVDLIAPDFLDLSITAGL
jgi:adenylate cyclase